MPGTSSPQPLSADAVTHPDAPRRAMLWLLIAAAVYTAILVIPWHPDARVRAAAALSAGALTLWISESAPLGAIGLLIPVVACSSGLLTWKDAVARWGDPIIMLFLGAFLLARALEKHGAFDRLGTFVHRTARTRGDALLVLVIILGAGALSAVQNNTAVTAMLLPIVIPIARAAPRPAIPLLALAYGASYGGMATPVGTAPNFIGFAALREVDPGASFLTWMRVGIPVWIGASAIGCFALWASRRITAAPVEITAPAAPAAQATAPAAPGVEAPRAAPVPPSVYDAAAAAGSARSDREPLAARAALIALGLTAAAWMTVGAIQSCFPDDHSAHLWTKRYLPESVPPIVAAVALFFVRVGRQRRAVLERRDINTLDFDTLFLVAGGLCLGLVLETSGAAKELAGLIGNKSVPPLVLYLTVSALTVLMSEIVSNTATAAMMVPIVIALAKEQGVDPGPLIMLVALSASLGVSLPISTPPNAIVYGSGLMRMRHMIVPGVIADVLGIVWVVLCVRMLA
ncbi:MAG: SLC13/DASS family transporter [Phycisphaerales bacterium]|nr:SLC13/DASS family transporter [Phycisphaerales bacterium]